MLPDGQLSTGDIDNFLKKCPITREHFLGTFPADVLPPIPSVRPLAVVWNTDPSSAPGEHWISCIVDSYGSVYYFDTSGQPPNKLILSNMVKFGLRLRSVCKSNIQSLFSKFELALCTARYIRITFLPS